MSESTILRDIRDAITGLREERTFRYAVLNLPDPTKIFVVQDPVVTDGKRVYIIPSSGAEEILAVVAELGYRAVRHP